MIEAYEFARSPASEIKGLGRRGIENNEPSSSRDCRTYASNPSHEEDLPGYRSFSIANIQELIACGASTISERGRWSQRLNYADSAEGPGTHEELATVEGASRHLVGDCRIHGFPAFVDTRSTAYLRARPNAADGGGSTTWMSPSLTTTHVPRWDRLSRQLAVSAGDTTGMTAKWPLRAARVVVS